MKFQHHEAHRPFTPTLPILMYHRICDDSDAISDEFGVSRSVFRSQLEYLAAREYYTPAFSSLIRDRISPVAQKRPIILTFDDGYLDTYEIAFPLLREFGFTAVVSLVADFSRRTNWWDEPAGSGSVQLMLPHHVAEMKEAGIEFSSHTYSHRPLTTLSEYDLVEEMKRSREFLEDIVGSKVSWLTYPYGKVGEREKRAAKAAGYICGIATNTGPLSYYADPFEIRRVAIRNRADASYLFFKLSGLDQFTRWSIWKMKSLLQWDNE
jgi:peptidoglycan/xylan/chitin deacetylase (PgdA/CDA1 family)